MIFLWLVFYLVYLFCFAFIVPRATVKRYAATPRDWQHRLAHVLFYSIPASYFLGVDQPPPSVALLSFVLFAGGGALAIWAVVSNPWFSPAIEMPPMVVTDGAFLLVNHPFYCGAGLMAIAGWLMVGHALAIIPLAAYLLLLTWRGWRESKMLR